MTRLDGEALHQRCIEAVVEEGERVGVLAQQLAAGLTPAVDGLDVPVPWVPAWTARDLIRHLGTVHRWATAIVRAGHTERPRRDATHEPPRDCLLDWYGAGLSELVTALRTTPPDSPAWHMSPTAEKSARSWARRQAHELAVHRMDLEAAAGADHAPLETTLAEDGVDELLTVIVPRWAHTEPLSTATTTAHVTATDTGRAWHVRVEQGRVTVTEGCTAADAHEFDAHDVDAHLAGDTTQLLLRLWGRPADVTVTGDPTVEFLLRGR